MHNGTLPKSYLVKKKPLYCDYRSYTLTEPIETRLLIPFRGYQHELYHRYSLILLYLYHAPGHLRLTAIWFNLWIPSLFGYDAYSSANKLLGFLRWPSHTRGCVDER